jgi:hypothetical protein
MAVITLDAYMMNYEPYREGNNPNHTYQNGSKTLSFLKQGYLNGQMKREFCTMIVQWLRQQLEMLFALGPVVVAIAPGHVANPNPTGFMHEIVGQVRYSFSQPLQPLQPQPLQPVAAIEYCPLVRTISVPKQSQTIGQRSENTHRGTIQINSNVIPNNSGKVVVILDDIWTSGSTLKVCREVMLVTKPKQVKLLAIGKTVN